MTALQPAVLDVQRAADGSLNYSLRIRETFGATEPVYTAHVDQKEIAGMCAGIDFIVQSANAAGDDDSATKALIHRGRALYNALLPKKDHGLTPLRDALRELAGPLLICTDQPDVQWELIYDDKAKNFLGLSRDVARRLKTQDTPSSPGVEPDGMRCLIIAAGGEDEAGWALPDATTEARQLHEWFRGREITCDVLQGEDATYRRTIDHLIGDPYHVIHYAGHIVRHDETMQFALRLKDELLPADRIRNQLNGNPIVFLNGCRSAASDASGHEGVQAMTSALLAGGARVVIGSIYPVPDIGARRFAECFYEQLLDGASYGTAMRHARTELSRDPSCRASWAGFVLYGNPCLTLVVHEVAPADDLASLYEASDLSAEEIDPGATAVLRQAWEHARPGGMLATAHMFAALVEGDDPALRDGLAARGLEPAVLRDAFASAFTTEDGKADGDGDEAVKLSANVLTILAAAAAVARPASRPVSEGDLQEAFVACAAGVTQQILEQLGVDMTGLLLPPTSAGATLRPVATGTGMQIAEAIAINAGHRLVGSPELLAGLLAVQPSPVTEALRRVGLRADLLDSRRARPELLQAPPRDELPTVRHTVNVEQILLLASAEAAAHDSSTIDDESLFAAFVKHGGGQTGASLLRRGLPLAVLTSPLFSDTSELRMERFDLKARGVLADAVDCARRKRQDRLDERHLLYGLLCAGGALAEAIRAQDRSPVQIADKLFVELPSSSAMHGHNSITRIGHMTTAMLVALCTADRCRQELQLELVGEQQLAGGLLSDGGAGAGNFLVDSAIALKSLPNCS